MLQIQTRTLLHLFGVIKQVVTVICLWVIDRMEIGSAKSAWTPLIERTANDSHTL